MFKRIPAVTAKIALHSMSKEILQHRYLITKKRAALSVLFSCLVNFLSICKVHRGLSVSSRYGLF